MYKENEAMRSDQKEAMYPNASSPTRVKGGVDGKKILQPSWAEACGGSMGKPPGTPKQPRWCGRGALKPAPNVGSL